MPYASNFYIDFDLVSKAFEWYILVEHEKLLIHEILII